MQVHNRARLRRKHEHSFLKRSLQVESLRNLLGPVLPGYYQEFLLPAVHSAAVRVASSLHYPSWRSAPGRTISCGKREVSSTRSVTLPTQRCTPPEPWVVMAIASHPPNSSSPS